MSKDLGPVWHGIAGIVIGMLTVFGFTREVLQHDLTLSAWQWLEALAWPVGGLLSIGVGAAILRRLKR